MFNPNPRRPLTRRQTARIVVATVILAWATQTLLQQWGYGAAPPVSDGPAMAALQNETVERFIPPTTTRPARLELRPTATVIGPEVSLRQIARWSQFDAPTFAPVADLAFARLGDSMPFRTITLDEVKATLRDAGVNLASIHLSGATSCLVNRSDVQFDEGQALNQWMNTSASRSRDGADSSASEPDLRPDIRALSTGANLAVPARVDAPAEEDLDDRSLRGLLIRDLCTRLNLRREQLQISFRPGAEKTLALSEPHFRFDLEPVRARNLGEVAWNVTIHAGESRQRVAIVADARMWQHQVLAARPIAHRQIIREEDLIEQRVLVDRLPEAPLLVKSQAVGQQASRDIKAGTPLTARLVDPLPLVRAGQFVTVTLSQGNIQIKTVAKALEGGAFGQTIRVKNETTRQVFQVVITGPQSAALTAAELSSAEGR
ncbi:MAG: flagellar basal body P-ring formation chaperone FlgA [Phycisphaerae bacterium]|nr:flagellar basal body P-ring formation chaperone FlgA [Phycisphaerae bacterium]MDW8262506.1 flagellar basal body P-ring formation chaperone FlgA [Phycisphaerales bacterium]